MTSTDLAIYLLHAGLSFLNWYPLKLVKPDRFMQKILPNSNWLLRTTFAAKIGPAGLILAAKTGHPLPILVYL